MERPRKCCVRGTEASLRGGELKVGFAQTFIGGSYRLDVGRRIRVETDYIIEVVRHLCQIFNDLVNHLDEPDGRSTAPLGPDEPLVEARGSVKRREMNGVNVRGRLMERGGKVEEGNHPSLPQGVEDLAHARNRQLGEAADLVEVLIVHGDPNAS